MFQQYLTSLTAPDVKEYDVTSDDKAAGAFENFGDVMEKRLKRGALECYNDCTARAEMSLYHCRLMCF